jgi:hypothetical protein
MDGFSLQKAKTSSGSAAASRIAVPDMAAGSIAAAIVAEA